MRFFLVGALLLAACRDDSATPPRPPVKCMENSPERRGEEGCTILANRPLHRRADNAYWHIDRFDSLEAATTVAGPDGVAAEAHGSFWLMTLGPRTDDHHGGQHVASIGPVVAPAADHDSMRVQSSLLMPGATTPAHTHPGPELLYIVDGEQCMEMEASSSRLGAGQSFVVPGGAVHRGRVIGQKPRRALGLALYSGDHPTSHDLDKPPPLASCH
jgi:quercetin dioxygenase-like cupin family protein